MKKMNILFYNIGLIFTSVLVLSCNSNNTKIDIVQFTKYKKFNEYLMKGEGVVTTEDSLLNKYLFVHKSNNDSIVIYQPNLKIRHIYYNKGGIWINKNVYYDKDLGDTIVNYRYSNGEGIILTQEIYLSHYSKESTVTLETKNWKSSIVLPYKAELNKENFNDITNRIKNGENRKRVISSGDCYRCLKVIFNKYLLIYKPLEEISDSEIQYVKKPKSIIKFGHLLDAYKLNELTEYEVSEPVLQEFLILFPDMEYY